MTHSDSFQQAGKLLQMKDVGGEIHLIPIDKPAKRPFSELFGLLEGKVWMADDFDAPLEEMKG